MNAISEYIRGSLEELHLVQWPTQQQSVRLTLIVIGFIAACAVFFGIVDGVLSEIIRLTFKI